MKTLLVESNLELASSWTNKRVRDIALEIKAKNISFESSYNVLGNTTLFLLLKTEFLIYKILASRSLATSDENREVTKDYLLQCQVQFFQLPVFNSAGKEERYNNCLLVLKPNESYTPLLVSDLSFQVSSTPNQLKIDLANVTIRDAIKSRIIDKLYEENNTPIFESSDKKKYLLIKTKEYRLHRIAISKILQSLTMEQFVEKLDNFTFYSGVAESGRDFFSIGMTSNFKITTTEIDLFDLNEESEMSFQSELEVLPIGLKKKLTGLTIYQAVKLEIINKLDFITEFKSGKTIALINGYRLSLPNNIEQLDKNIIWDSLSCFYFKDKNKIGNYLFHIVWQETGNKD